MTSRLITRKMFGESSLIKKTLKQAQALARLPTPILLVAEPGLEVVPLARLIHQWSGRAGLFLPVVGPILSARPSDTGLDAAFAALAGMVAIGESVKRSAGGTLLVEEIHQQATAAQTCLLTMLDAQAEGTFRSSPRLIATTSRDLRGLVASGVFSARLLDALLPAAIVLPPLRKRERDAIHIASRLLREHAFFKHRACVALGDDAMAALSAYDWPGNVAELERVVVRTAMLRGRGLVRGEDVARALEEAREVFAGVG